MEHASHAKVFNDLDAIMGEFRSDSSPTGITETAGKIVGLAKSRVPERAGLDHPVLQKASDYLVELARKGYNVGHIRDLLQGLANYFDPFRYERTPNNRTNGGPKLYEG